MIYILLLQLYKTTCKELHTHYFVERFAEQRDGHWNRLPINVLKAQAKYHDGLENAPCCLLQAIVEALLRVCNISFSFMFNLQDIDLNGYSRAGKSTLFPV